MRAVFAHFRTFVYILGAYLRTNVLIETETIPPGPETERRVPDARPAAVFREELSDRREAAFLPPLALAEGKGGPA